MVNAEAASDTTDPAIDESMMDSPTFGVMIVIEPPMTAFWKQRLSPLFTGKLLLATGPEIVRVHGPTPKTSRSKAVICDRVVVAPGGIVMLQLSPPALSSLTAQSHVLGKAVWLPI